jgi:hypothetical protein
MKKKNVHSLMRVGLKASSFLMGFTLSLNFLFIGFLSVEIQSFRGFALKVSQRACPLREFIRGVLERALRRVS